MQNKKDTMLMDAVKLFLITLIAGCLLGLVYQVTEEPIAIAKYNKKQEAYRAVYAGAASFEENDSLTAALANAEDVFDAAGLSGVYVSEVLEAKNEAGEVIGYVMNFGSNEGYGGTIDLSCGVDLDGMITGFKVLSMSETAGLGAKCTEESFQAQFARIQADQITYTKTGKSAPDEIDALSGATITTKAVTSAVNGALAFIHAHGAISEQEGEH